MTKTSPSKIQINCLPPKSLATSHTQVAWRADRLFYFNCIQIKEKEEKYLNICIFKYKYESWRLIFCFSFFIPDSISLFFHHCKVIERRKNEETENHKQYVVCLNSQLFHSQGNDLHFNDKFWPLETFLLSSIDRKVLHRQRNEILLFIFKIVSCCPNMTHLIYFGHYSKDYIIRDKSQNIIKAKKQTKHASEFILITGKIYKNTNFRLRRDFRQSSASLVN